MIILKALSSGIFIIVIFFLIAIFIDSVKGEKGKKGKKGEGFVFTERGVCFWIRGWTVYGTCTCGKRFTIVIREELRPLTFGPNGFEYSGYIPDVLWDKKLECGCVKNVFIRAR